MQPPGSIENLLGFNPPESVPLPDDVTVPFINAVKGKTFGKDDASLVSRYGSTDYDDHPLQELEFSADGKRLRSCCPGPDNSDASVSGPFLLKEIDADNNYVIELQYGCKTTFILKRSVINVEETAPTCTLVYLPELVTCQRYGCLQRHRTRFRNGISDYDELSGERKIGEPGVIQLRRCSRCKQVHYCSVNCQRSDWLERHRVECNNFGKLPSPDVSITSADVTDLKAVLMHIFQSCITGGEERSWGQSNVTRAKEVGRRLFAIGGKDLCVSVLEELRDELWTDKKRCSDTRLLEILWTDPVVPGWWF